MFGNMKMPLVLEFLLIQNLTLPSFTPSPTIIQLSKRAIAGVVIGSLVGLAFIIFEPFGSSKGLKEPRGWSPYRTWLTKTVESEI